MPSTPVFIPFFKNFLMGEKVVISAQNKGGPFPISNLEGK